MDLVKFKYTDEDGNVQIEEVTGPIKVKALINYGNESSFDPVIDENGIMVKIHKRYRHNPHFFWFLPVKDEELFAEVEEWAHEMYRIPQVKAFQQYIKNTLIYRLRKNPDQPIDMDELGKEWERNLMEHLRKSIDAPRDYYGY